MPPQAAVSIDPFFKLVTALLRGLWTGLKLPGENRLLDGLLGLLLQRWGLFDIIQFPGYHSPCGTGAIALLRIPHSVCRMRNLRNRPVRGCQVFFRGRPAVLRASGKNSLDNKTGLSLTYGTK
jgi:hypothetical protein